MRHSRRDPLRMVLATGLTLLMLTLSIAVPVLEQGALLHHPVVEAEHDPGECPSGHDHTICTQVGANLAIEAADVENLLESGSLALNPVNVSPTSNGHIVDRANPSRAPPLG